MELYANNLTGGTDPDVDIEITTAGGYVALPYQPIMANQVLQVANTLEGLEAGQFSKLFEGRFVIGERFDIVTYQDDSDPATFSTHGEKSNADLVTVPFTVAQDSVANGLATDRKNRTKKFLRIEASGPVIGSGINYLLQMTMACKIATNGDYKQNGVILARDFVAGARFDEDWEQCLQIVLINAVSAY